MYRKRSDGEIVEVEAGDLFEHTDGARLLVGHVNPVGADAYGWEMDNLLDSNGFMLPEWEYITNLIYAYGV